jgi:hypothetical protein
MDKFLKTIVAIHSDTGKIEGMTDGNALDVIYSILSDDALDAIEQHECIVDFMEALKGRSENE